MDFQPVISRNVEQRGFKTMAPPVAKTGWNLVISQRTTMSLHIVLDTCMAKKIATNTAA